MGIVMYFEHSNKCIFPKIAYPVREAIRAKNLTYLIRDCKIITDDFGFI